MKKLFIFIIIYTIIALLVFSTKTNKIKEHMTVNVDDYKFIGCYDKNSLIEPESQSNFVFQNTINMSNNNYISESKQKAATDNVGTFCIAFHKKPNTNNNSDNLYFINNISEVDLNERCWNCSSENIDRGYICIWINRNLLNENNKRTRK